MFVLFFTACIGYQISSLLSRTFFNFFCIRSTVPGASASLSKALFLCCSRDSLYRLSWPKGKVKHYFKFFSNPPQSPISSAFPGMKNKRKSAVKSKRFDNTYFYLTLLIASETTILADNGFPDWSVPLISVLPAIRGRCSYHCIWNRSKMQQIL